jgi:glycosyltransferase involved in cell wall biosynthesis
MYTRVPDVLLIEGSDFETFPAGGQLSMARALMKLFGDRLGLVGMDRGKGPVGRWTHKQILGTRFRFFPAGTAEPSGRKPLLPARLTFYAALRRFRKQILSLGCKAAFIQAPEALLAVHKWDWGSLCFWFAGVGNPLEVSRYSFARSLSELFDKSLYSALDRVAVILAAADEEAIRQLISRSNGRLARERLIQLPTCVDISEFGLRPLDIARAELGISKDDFVFVSSGRISRFKGWELLLTAFEQFLQRHPNARLVFVGDGEDRSILQTNIAARYLESRVKITGFQTPQKVASYLNAANVVVFGSLAEGWSAAMLEALACGKALVSTEVSGANAMIVPGKNGFVVHGRDPKTFADAMEQALQLKDAEAVSLSIAARFDLKRFGERLAGLWPPLRERVA